MNCAPTSQKQPGGLYPAVKRTLDLLGAAAGILVSAPAMVLIAIAIRFNMGRPVLFRQRRPGRHEQIFTCLKFKTMTDAVDESGQLLPDPQRLTGLGRFLRRTSLDELPQLWNILVGDLSFIGPRPLFESYLPYYTETERRRHSVRPGLTGWAQINGRNCVPFDERLRLDVWYVDHISWSLDLRIFLSTIWIVLTQRGHTADLMPLDRLRASQRALAAERELNHGNQEPA